MEKNTSLNMIQCCDNCYYPNAKKSILLLVYTSISTFPQQKKKQYRISRITFVGS